MTEQTQERKAVTVFITLPQGEKMRFVVDSVFPYAIYAHLRGNQNMCWYSNIILKTKKGTQIQPNTDLEPEIENDIIEATVYIREWDSKSVFHHAQQFARMLFTLTKYGDSTDCEESYISWISRTYGKSSFGKALPSESDYGSILPQSFLNVNQPRIIKFFDMDEQNFTTIDDDHFYRFKCTTHENEEFIIKSSKAGFYIGEDSAPHFMSLFDLLEEKSKYFAEHSALVSARWNSLHILERSSFTPIDRRNIFAISRKSNMKKLELFNRPTDQIQGSLRKFIQNEAFSENDLHAMNEGENFYIRMIYEGVKKIHNGEIKSVIEGRRTYLYNGVIISAIDEFAPCYANLDEANREICGFAQNALELQKINDSVEIDRPIVMDYLGQRYVVIYHENECVFGYGPDHSSFQQDERFAEFIEKLKLQFNFKEISKTTRGFITDDGKPILTHIGVLTPRDYNYPDPEKHAGYRIRSELIRPFEVHNALVLNEEELKELGGLPEYEYTNPNIKDEEQLKNLSEKRADIICKAPSLEYDINALTINADNDEVPETVKELAKYLAEVSLPKFIQSFVNSTPYSFDGNKLSTQLHKSGVNVRYLGKLVFLLDPSKPLHLSMIRIIECEMIIRSIKYIAREKCWSLDEIIKLIKTIITQGEGFDQLFEEICSISERKFSAKPHRPIELMAPYLKRSLLLTFGIVLCLKDSDLPLETSNVAMINPKVKFQHAQDFDLNAHVQIATNLFNNADLKNSYILFARSAQVAESKGNMFSKNLMTCHFYLGLIHFQQHQNELAFDSLINSLIIEERYSDDTDPDIVFKLTMLGMLANSSRNQRLAFAFFARAARVTQLLSPFHTWTIKTASEAAEAIETIDGNVAINFAQSAISSCKLVKGTPLMMANTYIAAAQVACEGDKLNLATKFADEAAKITKCDELSKVRAKIAQKQQKLVGRRTHPSKH